MDNDSCKKLKMLAEKIDDVSRYAENISKIRQSLKEHGGRVKIYVYTNKKTGEMEISTEMSERIFDEMDCAYRESIKNAKDTMDSIIDEMIKSIGR